MISIYHKIINKIPSLIVVDSTLEKEPLPTLTYYHGFTSAKEQNLTLAYLLAEKGFRIVLPDSKYHGERESTITANELELSFWDIVLQNVVEVAEIKEFLDQEGLLLNNRFGLAGTSMGGITTSSALTQYPWIKVAAVLMGSPKNVVYANLLIKEYKKGGNLAATEEEIDRLLKQLAHYDLSVQFDKLNDRPLLFWHGEADSVIPFDHAHSFYSEAIKHYKNPDNIRFIKEANRDHRLSHYAVLETVKWFETNL